MFERLVLMKNTENTQEFEVVPVPADVLPCPFCGSVAKIVVLGQAEDNGDVYGGVCMSCFSVGRPCITPMEAAFYWNKRVK